MPTPTSLCDKCKAKGLAILPVRYAIVPTRQLPGQLPAWAAARTDLTPEIHADYRHALRIMRAGYLYIYYGDGPNTRQWECFTVSNEGFLWRQASPLSANPPSSPGYLCNLTNKSAGHKDGRLQHIWIEQPDKVSKVWIAFSEHKWNKATLDNYAANDYLRGERMQLVSPKNWIDALSADPAGLCPKGPAPATAASAATLEAGVIEYMSKLAKLTPSADDLAALSPNQPPKKLTSWQLPDETLSHFWQSLIQPEFTALQDKMDELRESARKHDRRIWDYMIPSISNPNPSTAVASYGADQSISFVQEKRAHFVEKDLRLLHRKEQRRDRISKSDDGTLDAERLAFQSTQHTWFLRNTAAELAETIGCMQERIDNPAIQPMLLALPDAAGCATELNGFRNEVSGNFQRYSEELDLQINALDLIDNLEKNIHDQYVELRYRSAENTWYDPQRVAAQRQQSIANHQRFLTQNPLPDPAALRAHQRRMDYYDILDVWGQQGQPDSLHDRLEMARTQYNTRILSEQEYDIEISSLKTQAARNGTLAERIERDAQQHAHEKAESARKKEKVFSLYQDQKLDVAALNAFRSNYAAAQKAVDSLLDRRSEALIKYLKAPVFTLLQKDYAPGEAADGLALMCLAGNVLAGIDASPAGRALIDEWIDEAQKTISDSNLVWPVLAMRHPGALKELQEYAKFIDAEHKRQTLANESVFVAYVQKSLKSYSSLYKERSKTLAVDLDQKMSSARTKVEDAISSVKTSFKDSTHPSGSKVKPAINEISKAVDQYLDAERKALGDGFWRYSLTNRTFRKWGIHEKLQDHLSTRLNQHVLQISAFVPEKASQASIEAEMMHAENLRGELTQKLQANRLKKGSHFFGDPAKAGKDIEDFKSKLKAIQNRTLSPKEVVNARFAPIGVALEALNLAKCLADLETKGDAKSVSMLTASILSLTSNVADIIAVGAVLHKTGGSKGVWFRRTKLFGGAANCAAGAIGVVWDAITSFKESNKGHTALARVYQLKAALGTVQSLGYLASGMKSFGTTWAISTKYADWLGGRSLINKTFTSRLMLSLFPEGIVVRCVLFTVGGWITAIGVAIQLTIWYLEDSPFQSWIESGPFGKGGKDDGFFDVPDQYLTYMEAMSGS